MSLSVRPTVRKTWGRTVAVCRGAAERNSWSEVAVYGTSATDPYPVPLRLSGACSSPSTQRPNGGGATWHSGLNRRSIRPPSASSRSAAGAKAAARCDLTLSSRCCTVFQLPVADRTLSASFPAGITLVVPILTIFVMNQSGTFSTAPYWMVVARPRHTQDLTGTARSHLRSGVRAKEASPRTAEVVGDVAMG